jgi:hypothetical protein
MNFKEKVWGSTNWIYIAQDKRPVAGSCEHGNESSGSIKCENTRVPEVLGSILGWNTGH